MAHHRSLHYAAPDFLLMLVASANFMRLSLTKAARVDVGQSCVAGNPGTLRSKITIEQDLRGVERTADPSTTLRSGRDDKSEGGAFLKFDWWLELGASRRFSSPRVGRRPIITSVTAIAKLLYDWKRASMRSNSRSMVLSSSSLILSSLRKLTAVDRSSARSSWVRLRS